MGNCQAAEAATVLIQHPVAGRVERIYWSVSASQVMASNPGHYVAVIVTSNQIHTSTNSSSSNSSSSSATSATTANADAPVAAVKYLKLLRPDDTLHIGHVYRLVSFEEALKEFASKKHVKLSRLLLGNKEKSRRSKRSTGADAQGRAVNLNPETSSPAQEVEGQVVEAEAETQDRSSSSRSGPVPRPGQWRPALQSIAEFGSLS